MDLAHHIRHRDSIRNPYISEFLSNQYLLVKTIFLNHQPNNVIRLNVGFSFVYHKKNQKFLSRKASLEHFKFYAIIGLEIDLPI